MPALPSGRHVAVDPAPLRKLLVDAASPFNAHHLMALQSVDDLFRWLDLLTLAPTGSLTDAERAAAQPAPEGAPPGYLAVPTGARVADWRMTAAQWSATDRTAFADFVEDRVQPAIAGVMDDMPAKQAALLRTPTLAGALATMWREGVHPLQKEDDE